MHEMIQADLNEIETLQMCPRCKSEHIKKYKSFETLSLSICKECKLTFTSTRVKEYYIGKYYGMKYVSNFSKASTNEQPEFFNFYKNELSNVKNLLNKSEQYKLLEIGCGGGFFSGCAKDMGFDVVGQDISEENVKNLEKEYGIKGYSGKIEGLNFTEAPFDVIAMHHVLEHVYDLHSFLDKVYKLLKGDGVVVVLIPNLFSLDGKVDKELYKRMLSLPFHNYHFTRETFASLIKEKDFYIALEGHSPSKVLLSPFVLLKKILQLRHRKNRIEKNSVENTYSIKKDKKTELIKSFISKLSYGEQFAFYLKKEN